MKVKDMNKIERPREKALMNGISSLSNRELIALLLRSGTKKKSALELADALIEKNQGLGNLAVCDLQHLMKIEGIKEAKAVELGAAFELGRRIAFEKVIDMESIEKPLDIVDWLYQQIGYQQQEHFLVLFLNQKNKVICYKTLFIGTLTSTNVHPREIFKEAMALACARIVCIHNHPSGDPSPSDADFQITRCIVESGRIVAIPLMDHIIVSKNKYFSFREQQLLEE